MGLISRVSSRTYRFTHIGQTIQTMLLFLISGKRKSGKDYVANFMAKQNPEIKIYHISKPLKCQFAIENNLNFQELCTSSTYKEKYRTQMVKWGEEQRSQDPSIFCSKIKFYKESDQLQMNVVCDIRRKTDIEYFKNKYTNTTKHRIVTVRILSDLPTRESRGFVFDENIDNSETECDLDEYDFDFTIENYAKQSDDSLLEQFTNIFECVAMEIEDFYDDEE